MSDISWFERFGLGAEADPARESLREEGFLLLPDDSRDLEVLRSESARIATSMDSGGDKPPMLWSGMPLPDRTRTPTCDYHLVVSVGGTKTEFALLRMVDGELIGLDPASGRETTSFDEIVDIKNATRMATPKVSPEVPDGAAMLRAIASHMSEHLRPQRDAALERCRGVLLGWGYAHRIIRTGLEILGGVAGLVTKMTKDQGPFTKDLRGKDVGELLVSELSEQLDWEAPVAVANDTVMSLFYFLGPRWSRFHRVGLFINGTGTNFAMAEPYAVRPSGYVSDRQERYEPDRITAKRRRRPNEIEREFIVNYESGSIELDATRTRFDTEVDYPLERNVLAGGHALPQQFHGVVEGILGEDVYEPLRVARRRPRAPEIGRLASMDATPATIAEIFNGYEVSDETARALGTLARAVVNRSAMHAALVLDAVTRRNGFGLGRDGAADLVGMEGSVWKIPAYSRLVRGWWQAIRGDTELNVEFGSEPSFNASLPGPLYLAALHRKETQDPEAEGPS